MCYPYQSSGRGEFSYAKFEYYNLLYPKIKEFRWHLRDEIFQNQDIKLKNIHLLFALMMHIKEGVKRNFKLTPNYMK